MAKSDAEDLLSRIACIQEACSWDRPYDYRIAAIRGMCDLNASGLEPIEVADYFPIDWQERASLAEDALTRAEAERDAALAKVARVEALADEWDMRALTSEARKAPPKGHPEREAFVTAVVLMGALAKEVRAALADEEGR